MLVRPPWLLWSNPLDADYPEFEDVTSTSNRFRLVDLLAPQSIPLATLGVLMQLLHLDLAY